MKVKIKKIFLSLMCISIGITTLISCSTNNAQIPYLKNIKYSNLSDDESISEVKLALENAGFESQEIELFLSNVKDFNETISNTGLTKKGFENSKNLNPEYDIILMQEKLNEKYPDYLGNNCRITSFNFMKNFVEILNPIIEDDSQLFLDESSIENSPNKEYTQEEKNKFKSLFSAIPTESTKDINIHLENVKKNWSEKKISFKNSDKASFISVFFHYIDPDETSTLFIGHMGILIPTEKGKLLFLEKLSFQEPYQALKFDNKSQLNDYLMNKYDIEWGQKTSKPFILENDELLEGYRPNPNNLEEKNE